MENNNKIKSNKKIIKGVVKKVNPKTICVLVERKTKHPLYKKNISFLKKYYAHDEKNVAKINDDVLIIESRPMSALKRFKLLKVVESTKVKKKSKLLKQ